MTKRSKVQTPPHRKLDGCEQFASYYIKENLTINAAKWDAQTKNIKNWNIKWIYFIKAKSKYFNFILNLVTLKPSW